MSCMISFFYHFSCSRCAKCIDDEDDDCMCSCLQLVFGNSGVLQGIGSGKSYVDMSTVDVETMADVYEVCSS